MICASTNHVSARAVTHVLLPAHEPCLYKSAENISRLIKEDGSQTLVAVAAAARPWTDPAFRQ